MQVIVTIAGHGQRFKEKGFDKPKPLIDVLGQPAILHLINCFNPSWKLFFIIGEQYRNSSMESCISEIKPDSQIIYTQHSERGPVDTIYAALPHLSEKESVAVSYCDYAMLWNPRDFENFVISTDCDCSIISYQGFHPTYLGPNTYAHLQVEEKSNRILKIQEKKFFTDNLETEWTSCGFYYFKTAALLKKGLDLQIEKNLKYGNEFYTSLAIQALLEMPSSKSISVLNYKIDQFMQMGTPFDIELIQKWYELISGDKIKTAEDLSAVDKKLFNYWNLVFKKLSYSISSR